MKFRVDHLVDDPKDCIFSKEKHTNRYDNPITIHCKLDNKVCSLYKDKKKNYSNIHIHDCRWLKEDSNITFDYSK
jgi:hypothetical protein